MTAMDGEGESEAEPARAMAAVSAALRSWELPPLSIQPIEAGGNGEVFLLSAGARRWVAKLAHAIRRHFEPGLAVAWRLSKVMPVEVATPVRTVRGDFVEMVQWSAGHRRPLAVLDFVDGEPLSHSSTDAPETMGHVTGLLARHLRDVDPVDVGLDPSSPFVPGTREDDWNLGEYRWLNDLSDELAQRVHRLLPQLPHTVAIWDGPEILLDGDAIGLIDFGTADWMPRVHPIARGSLLTAYDDPDRHDRFLAAVEQQLPLTERERRALGLFRMVNATIYARWSASQLVERNLNADHHITRWLSQLLAVIHTD